MELPPSPPKIAILCWEEGQVPRGLIQLETLRGNSTNADSYAYPVRFSRIEGANVKTILEKPDGEILARMIDEARRLVAEEHIEAVTTSCGFNAIFQRELADSLDVPVFTSSLLQVPLVSSLIGTERTVAVITAKKAALREDHLLAVAIDGTIPLHILGMENCSEWNKIFTAPDEAVDLDLIADEVLTTARQAWQRNPAIGAFVLECTDLPPFSRAIRKETGLPVFDFITLVDWVHGALRL